MILLSISLLCIRILNGIDSDTLTNVVISANRQTVSEQHVSLPIYQSKVSNTQVINTPELFQAIPGVFLQRTNWGGGSPFVRGLTGNQTLIVLDGIRFNNSTFRYGPNQYLNTIDSYNLASLEVLRGSGAVQYGSDALTGVIQLFSQRPELSEQTIWKGNLVSRWASQGMELSQLGKIEYRSNNSAYLFSAAIKKFGDITRGGDNALQHPSGFEENALFYASKHKLGKQWILENQVQQKVQSNVPVYHKILLENYEFNEMSLQKYQRIFSRFTYQSNHPFFESMELTGSFQNSQENRRLKKNGSTIIRNEEDIVQTYGLTAQMNHHWIKNLTSANGIELYVDQVKSKREDNQLASRGLYPNNAKYTTLSAYSIHQLSLKNVQLHAGLRYQQVVAFLPDTTVGNTQISMGAFVYDLGYSVPIHPSISLFSSISTGFRSPNLDDLGSLGIVDFRYELPAYQLKPEYSFTKNLGFRVHTSSWNAEITGFHTNISNLINRYKTTELIQNYPVYKKENVDNAFLAGFEWNQTIQILSNLQVTNQVSYVYGQNQSQNEPMRRISPLHGTLGINWRLNQVKLGLQSVFAVRQDRLSAADKSDNRMNPAGTPGWGIFNVSAEYSINKHILMSCQVVNLNNIPYRMHGSGIDGMGRSLHVQICYNW